MASSSFSEVSEDDCDVPGSIEKVPQPQSPHRRHRVMSLCIFLLICVTIVKSLICDTNLCEHSYCSEPSLTTGACVFPDRGGRDRGEGRSSNTGSVLFNPFRGSV